MYSTYIAMVRLQLELRLGNMVVDSGHLHTFDFRAERVEKARAEFM